MSLNQILVAQLFERTLKRDGLPLGFFEDEELSQDSNRAVFLGLWARMVFTMAVGEDDEITEEMLEEAEWIFLGFREVIKRNLKGRLALPFAFYGVEEGAWGADFVDCFVDDENLSEGEFIEVSKAVLEEYRAALETLPFSFAPGCRMELRIIRRSKESYPF